MWEDRLYISPNYIIDDYRSLDLNMNSSEDDWNIAISILVDRINGRYLDIVRELLRPECRSRNAHFGSSFSVMAIECLLVETLQQFYSGANATPKPNNKAFISFFMKSKNFRRHFDEGLAKKFYKDIRCGILHQAQTKGNSQLTYTSEYMVERIRNGIRINVVMFSEALINEFEDYVHLLESGNKMARENFLKKMRFIVDTNY